MEREWLAERLAGGASIEAIAREVGRGPVHRVVLGRKHGLTSSHAPRTPHAADRRELLAEIVGCELSIRDMAEMLERSPDHRPALAATPRVETPHMARIDWQCRARGGGGDRRAAVPAARLTRHVRRQDGFRCARCRVEHVADKRRRIKRHSCSKPVDGASCAATTAASRPFSSTMSTRHEGFALSQAACRARSPQARAEAAKCVLLCANCHAEVEGGFARSSRKIGRSVRVCPA